MAHADERLVQLLEKRSRLIAERDALISYHEDMLADGTLASCIVWLVETIFPEIEEVDDLQMVCQAMIMAWNVSVRGEDVLPDTVTPELLELLRVLVARKKDAFPDDRRFVAEHYWEDGGTTLVVEARMEI